MSDITKTDVKVIAEHRDTIVAFMRRSIIAHATAINSELSEFDAQRDRDSVRWAQLCTIKSILSPGAKLDRNIALAKLLTDALRDGATLETYDDVEDYRKACTYGSRSVGNNILNALLSWSVLHAVNPDELAQTLATMPRVDKKTPGMGLKTSAWARALYDSRARVFTLDVHMCRGIAELVGLDRDGITDAAYPMLESLMLDIVSEHFPVHDPLVAQWAMWNEFRHPGEHASHVELAR